MPRMSAVDVAWLRMEETDSAADIVALLWLDGVLDEARLKAILETRLLSHARFCQRVISGPVPRWQAEASPSIDRHVVRYSLPAPGGPNELLETIQRLANEPLDFSRSPWRVSLLEGAPEGSVVLVQVHHCMGDGFALVDTLLSITDESMHSPPEAQRTPSNWRARAAAVLAGARRAPRFLSDLAYLVRLPFDPPNALHGQLAGRRGLAFSAPYELSRLKALAHARHATVNDALLAITSAGLRRYLADRGALPRRIRALMPVNLRPPSEPLDLLHGNWFGLVYVELPVAESDRPTRLAQLRDSIAHIKVSEQSSVSLIILAALGRAPRALEHLARLILARKASLVVSNVPGPRQAFHLGGRRVRDIVFWVPHPSGLGCGISLFSYAGRVRIGVRADLASVAEPAQLVQEIERELLAWEAELAASEAHASPA